jgi:4-amino-4-deoxy-L-arabinose transferase-like glycosyltransferase
MARMRRVVVLLVAGAALVVYLSLCLVRLEVVPAVGDDEGWIASSSFKLATEGVYGSDLLTGYFGSEHHTFHHLPLYPLLQAALFRCVGTSVASMRALSVFCGGVVLVLVCVLGRQLGGDRVAGLAVLLLLGLRLVTTGSGVPLLDSARVARYDVAVPALGLLALLVFLRRGTSGRGAALAGVLVGLSSLCHVYGAFLLPVLAVFVLARSGGRYLRLGLLVLGFVLPWLPCIAFAAGHWTDCLGQLRRWDGGFDLLSPSAYAENLIHEIDRYRPLDLMHWARPGIWVALCALPVAVLALLRRSSNDAALVAWALIGEALLFALLLRVKTFSYVIALWPLAVLALAWLGVQLWDARRVLWTRGLLLALLAAILAEGGAGIRASLAAPATSYAAFEARLDAVIPRQARVLALPRFWLGLRDRPCRSWTLPFYLSESRYSAAPVGFDRALEEIAPGAIVIDRDMRRFFSEASLVSHPRHASFVAFESFLLRQHAGRAASVSDATYGEVEIYLLAGSAR